MPGKFLTRNELYRLLQRELPEGVYPDSGDPSKYLSTASIDAKAGTMETVYTNLNRVYDNYFPQFADEKIADWEVKVFGEVDISGLSLPDRRNRIINKLRKKPQIALWELLTLVANAVPEGVYVQIVEWGCADGGGGNWILGKSKLGVDTALGWGSSALIQGVVNGDFCSVFQNPDGWRFGKSRLGIETRLTGSNTWQTISAAQKKAYTYEVRIFMYALSGADLDRLDRDLSIFEPARSGHVIRQNLSLATYGLIFDVSPVDQFSGVNCITRDSGSSTGYSGKVTT